MSNIPEAVVRYRPPDGGESSDSGVPETGTDEGAVGRHPNSFDDVLEAEEFCGH